MLKVDKARMLLAEAKDVGQAKKVADLARAAEVYAQRQKLSEEAIGYATAVKIEAMTLMGKMLRQTPKAPAGRPPKQEIGSNKEPISTKPITYAQAGIGKKEASDAQVLADLEEKKPEAYERVKAGKTTISKARRELKNEQKREELKARAATAPPAPVTWSIITGDCVAHLHGLPPGGVRLVFADPPYNQGVDYGEGHDDRLSDLEFITWCRRWMQAAADALAPDGSMWVLISDEYADRFGVALSGLGLHRKQWLVWYESFGVCDSDKRGFARSSRHLLWYVKDPRNFVFHPEAVTRDSWRLRNGDKRADPGGRTWDSVWGIDPPIPRLVGTAAERIPDFPTQLPLALVRPIVGCASDPGDLVVDPFSGSGTTAAVCVELGRRFIGVERSARFADLARLRLRGVAA